MWSNVMFNAYPDSLGGQLSSAVDFLQRKDIKGIFDSFYLLPTLFHTDLDRGFSIIDYSLNRELAKEEDLASLKKLGVSLTADMILNHISVLSPQFRDLLLRGDASAYRDFFIDWNAFWGGRGEVDQAGVLHPDRALIREMHFRKPGLPVLSVRFPDGRDVPYWNTFYQKTMYPTLTAQDVLFVTDLQYAEAAQLSQSVNAQIEAGVLPDNLSFSKWEQARAPVTELLLSRRQILGQMDLNAQNEKVWTYYGEVMDTLHRMGVRTVRLDAFVRLHKAPGRANFMNEPETWEYLIRLKEMAQTRDMEVLPEMHATYISRAFEKLKETECPFYDFYMPGLILDAVYTGDPSFLCAWENEIIRMNAQTVSMLGCHDGIPVRDLTGLLPEQRRMRLAEEIENRGGVAKWIHGEKTEIYQMCCTYFSALDEDERKMAFARALQVFLPGVCQVWYMDLMCRPNDLAALSRQSDADAREINRTVLNEFTIAESLGREGVQAQLALLRLRAEHPAFQKDSRILCEMPDAHILKIKRTSNGISATLLCNFKTFEYTVSYT